MTEPHDLREGTEPKMALEHLFTAELRFRPGMSPVVPVDGREGELVGSGDGTVQGPLLNGRIRWSNFETQGERLCGMFPAGVIEADDGAKIRFDARGWALRPNEGGGIWQVGGALRLEADEPRYARLGERLALWEGEFDASAGQAMWRVYGTAAPLG